MLGHMRSHHTLSPALLVRSEVKCSRGMQAQQQDAKQPKLDADVAVPATAQAVQHSDAEHVPAASAPDGASPAADEPAAADIAAAPHPAAPAAAPAEAPAAGPDVEQAPQSLELEWAVRGGGGRGRSSAAAGGGGGHKHRSLDPVVPVTTPSLLDPIRAFYGLEASFPLATHTVTRCLESLDRPRRLYYVSDSIRRALMLDEHESLKVTATGLKVRACFGIALAAARSVTSAGRILRH
jgi:hypothetical protein